MDFENADFYKEAYHVVKWWAIAATVGPLGGILPIVWTYRRWSQSSGLWKVEEDPKNAIQRLTTPISGAERQWQEGTDLLYWLT